MGLPRLYTEKLFILMIFILFCFLIGYFVIGYVTYDVDLTAMKCIVFSKEKAFLEHKLFRFFGVVTGTVFLLLVYSCRKNILEITYHGRIALFSILFFLAYYVLLGSQFRGMIFFSLLNILILFVFFPYLIIRYRVGYDFILIKKILIFLLLIYLLSPLIVYIIHYCLTFEKYFQNAIIPQLYIVDSFRGFTFDRIQYGFLAGITLLLLFFERKNIRFSNVLMLLLSLGLFLTMARASFLALLFALLLLFYLQKNLNIKNLLFLVGSIGFILVMISLFALRSDVFADGGGRLDIIIMGIEKILEHGYIGLLFGEGDFYTTYQNGLYPHNSILQSIMDFGLIITIMWFIILFDFWRSLKLEAKIIFTYTLVFGLFHPGFSAFLFMPLTSFSYILVLL